MDFNAKEFKTVKNPRFIIKSSDNSRKFANVNLDRKEILKMKEIPVAQSSVKPEKRKLPNVPVEMKTSNKEILPKQDFKNSNIHQDMNFRNVQTSRARELAPGLIKTETNQDASESLTTLQAGTYCGSFTVNEKGLIIAAKNLNLVKRIEAGSGLEISSAQGVSKINLLPSLVLSGTPTAPTPSIESNSEQIATTAYVNALIKASIEARVKEAVEAAVADVIQATIKAMGQE